MNIVKTVKKLSNKVKNGYDNTQLNPFKFPEKLKVEFTINYTESLKSLPKTKEDLQIISSFIKLVKKEIDKELK